MWRHEILVLRSGNIYVGRRPLQNQRRDLQIIIKFIVAKVDGSGPELCSMACPATGGVEFSAPARLTKEVAVIHLSKNNSASADCGTCPLLLTPCVQSKEKLIFIHTISRITNAGVTVYGNWCPQVVPAPELSTSSQETRVNKNKNENTNNETVSVLGSPEFQLSITSVKCVTSAACISEQERRMVASQVV